MQNYGHNVLPQENSDEVKGDAILLLYVFKKNIKVNLTHAFAKNLMRGKSNVSYEMVLTKVFKKGKINLKSKAPGKYKGDFNKSTLKSMKLSLAPLSDEFVIMGETIEEQVKREEK